MGRCYCAPAGERQPRSAFSEGPEERVLHLAISTETEPQAGQEAVLRLLGPYRRVNWWMAMKAMGRPAMEAEVLLAAWEHRPTLVWMQVQTPGVLSREFLRALRGCCGPMAVLVLWTGDTVDYEATEGGKKPATIARHAQPWMMDVGEELDLLTASCCEYPEEVAAGSRCATGFMQCGYDRSQFDWRTDRQDVPCAGHAVLTAHRYPTMEEESRADLARAVGSAIPGRLHVWGGGWSPPPPGVDAHGVASFLDTSYLYSHARVTVSTSCTNSLRRYTSGRLQRILGSAGCCAVRAFDDMGALGLVDGTNCLVWRDAQDLVGLLRDWLRPERDREREAVRSAAYSLATGGMDWLAAYEETMWMVRRERERMFY